MMKIEDRTLVSFLEPERARAVSDLQKEKRRLTELMDGRDTRPHAYEIVNCAKRVVRLQHVVDVLGGHEISVLPISAPGTPAKWAGDDNNEG